MLLAAVALWIRGYWVSDGVMYDNGRGHCLAAASFRGGLCLESVRQQDLPPTHRVIFSPGPDGQVSGDVWAAPGPPGRWRCVDRKFGAADLRTRYEYPSPFSEFTIEHRWAGFVVGRCQCFPANGGFSMSYNTTYLFDGNVPPLEFDGLVWKWFISKRILVIPWWFITLLLSIAPAL